MSMKKVAKTYRRKHTNYRAHKVAYWALCNNDFTYWRISQKTFCSRMVVVIPT